VVRFLLHCMY